MLKRGGRGREKGRWNMVRGRRHLSEKTQRETVQRRCYNMPPASHSQLSTPFSPSSHPQIKLQIEPPPLSICQSCRNITLLLQNPHRVRSRHSLPRPTAATARTYGAGCFHSVSAYSAPYFFTGSSAPIIILALHPAWP